MTRSYFTRFLIFVKGKVGKTWEKPGKSRLVWTAFCAIFIGRHMIICLEIFIEKILISSPDFLKYSLKLAEKLSPKVIRFFFKPLLTLLIMTPLTFCIVGPIVIMLGMHYAVTIPLALAAIQAFGYDMLGPGFLVANIAQGVAALAVARLAKDKDFRSLAMSTGISAILGTTEPALYGVNLRLKRPLYATIIGGCIGGILCGAAGVKRIVFGPTGLTSIAIFIDPNNALNFVFALAGVAVTFVATYVITYMLVKKDNNILKEIG